LARRSAGRWEQSGSGGLFSGSDYNFSLAGEKLFWQAVPTTNHSSICRIQNREILNILFWNVLFGEQILPSQATESVVRGMGFSGVLVGRINNLVSSISAPL
jgi:hypothetical protein